MSANKIIFDVVRPMLDGGFTPARIAALDAACSKFAQVVVDAVPAPTQAAHGERLVSAEGIAMKKHFESCELEAYPDPGSRDGKPWTIGWGATGPGIERGTKWTQAQADARYEQDLVKFTRGVGKLLPPAVNARTTQAQFDALVVLAYNIGLGNFGSSTLLKRHIAGATVEVGGSGNPMTASGHFHSWRFNDGKEMRGLIRRRAAEAAHYRGGDWRAADVTVRKELGL